ATTHDREGGAPRLVAARAVVQGVLASRAAAAFVAGKHLASVTMATAGVTAALAAPLLRFGAPIGVLYLDTRAPDASFAERDLEAAQAVAGIAAVALEGLRHVEWLEGENRRLRDDLGDTYGLVGESPAMRELYAKIGKVAPNDTTVLVLGESGTGKELVARAL